MAEPIVVTTVDPWSWTSDAVTGSTDGFTATYTIKSTPGNDGTGIYLLVTDEMGTVVKETGFVPLNEAIKNILIDGMLPGRVYTFRFEIKSPGKPVEPKPAFTWKSSGGGGGTVGISSVNTSSLIVYPNPFTNVLNIDNLKKGAEVILYDLKGRKVYKTTEKLLNVSHLPLGTYFLGVDGNKPLKVTKDSE